MTGVHLKQGDELHLKQVAEVHLEQMTEVHLKQVVEVNFLESNFEGSLRRYSVRAKFGEDSWETRYELTQS